MLGNIKIRTEGEIAERTKRSSVAVGVAWTPTRGHLSIEANKMKGQAGGFAMSGQPGGRDARVDVGGADMGTL
jgi:ATP-dependent Lon protease